MMKQLDYLGIGNRIRLQREFLGYTRDYLAEKLSVSTNFCRDIEIGAKGMSIQTLVNISSELRITTDYILLGKISDHNEELEPLFLMLNSCKAEKRKYAMDIMKAYLLALD